MVFDFLLKRRRRQAVPEHKASATGRVVACGRRAGWPGARATRVSLTQTGFQGNPVGFRAVQADRRGGGGAAAGPAGRRAAL